MLELEDSLGVEQVVLALAAPLVFAAYLQRAMGTLLGVIGKGEGMACRHLVGKDVVADAAEAADRAHEAVPDHFVTQAYGLEDLRTGVGRHGGDAHLGHDLEQALVARLDDVLTRPLGGHVRR